MNRIQIHRVTRIDSTIGPLRDGDAVLCTLRTLVVTQEDGRQTAIDLFADELGLLALPADDTALRRQRMAEYDLEQAEKTLKRIAEGDLDAAMEYAREYWLAKADV